MLAGQCCGKGGPGVRAGRDLSPGSLGWGQGAGLFFIIPIMDRMVKVDLRVITLDIPSQDCITNDNVTVKVNAVAYYRVVDPELAVVAVEDYPPGHVADRPDQPAQRHRSERVGRDAGPPRNDQRAVADHHRRADRALGGQGQHRRGQGRGVAADHAAGHGPPGRGRARKAGQDHPRRGRVPGQRSSWPRPQRSSATQPAAIQLRYLQTLTEIAVEKNSTIIFPVPIEMLRGLGALFDLACKGSGSKKSGGGLELEEGGSGRPEGESGRIAARF